MNSLVERAKKRHGCDGVNAFIFDWDRRRLSGWSYHVKDGDEVVVPMKSGKHAILKVKNLKRMSDPPDQYFADLEDIGYLESATPAKEEGNE